MISHTWRSFRPIGLYPHLGGGPEVGQNQTKNPHFDFRRAILAVVDLVKFPTLGGAHILRERVSQGLSIHSFPFNYFLPRGPEILGSDLFPREFFLHWAVNLPISPFWGSPFEFPVGELSQWGASSFGWDPFSP